MKTILAVAVIMVFLVIGAGLSLGPICTSPIEIKNRPRRLKNLTKSGGLRQRSNWGNKRRQENSK